MSLTRRTTGYVAKGSLPSLVLFEFGDILQKMANCGMGWVGGLLGGQRWRWPHVRDMWQRLFFRFHRVSVLPAEWTLADRTRDDAREVRARFLMQGWIKRLCSPPYSPSVFVCLSLSPSLSFFLSLPFLMISVSAPSSRISVLLSTSQNCFLIWASRNVTGLEMNYALRCHLMCHLWLKWTPMSII